VLSVKGGKAVVEIGGKRFNIAVERLYKIVGGEDEVAHRVDVNVTVEPMESTTLDLRGLTREEALEQLDAFLDRAVLNSLREVKIIHGVGEGVLILAVRESLKADPRVRSLRPGGPADGGMGVSYAVLK